MQALLYWSLIFPKSLIISVGAGRRHIEGIGRQASLMCDRVRINNNIETQSEANDTLVPRAESPGEESSS